MDQCLTQQGKDEPKDPTWDPVKDKVHSFPLTPWSCEIFKKYLYTDMYFGMTGIIIKIKENVVKWAKQLALILSLALPLSF